MVRGCGWKKLKKWLAADAVVVMGGGRHYLVGVGVVCGEEKMGAGGREAQDILLWKSPALSERRFATGLVR